MRTGTTSRERVHPHAQLQPMVTPESDDENTRMRISKLLTPYLHQLDHHNQLNRGIAPEDTKDLDRVSEYLHIHPRMQARSSPDTGNSRGR